MIDFNKYLRPGSRIEMNYIDERGQLKKYISQVVEIHENGLIDTLLPIHKKRDINLRQNTVLKLIIIKETAVYELKAVVFAKILGGIPLLRLKMYPEVNRIQRRNYYRLRIMRDIEVMPVEDIEGKKYGSSRTCSLLDICVGGMLFCCSLEFDEKTALKLIFDLDDRRFTILGIICRRSINDKNPSSYLYGVKFINMNESDKNAINKYIFEEQRKLIKKGLM